MHNLLIHVCFFFSGISGLIYQVVWVRQFGNVFGNSVYSASAVSGVFLFGLGLGSYWVGGWSDRSYQRDVRTPLRAYGLFELAIAGWGLAIALFFPALEPLSAAVSEYVPTSEGWFQLSFGSHLFRYAVALGLLLPITFLMGGTLTLLIRYTVRRDLDVAGWRIGALFGINTAGSAVGAFFSDFALIPQLGIFRAQAVAVAINAVAGVGALLLAGGRARPAPSPVRTERDGEPRSGDAASRRLLYTAATLFLAGTAAMGMEILWFRFLITAVGPYRSVFSLLLTVILIAICGGSLLGGSLHRRYGHPILLFAGAQCLFVSSALVELATFDPDYATRALFTLQGSYRDASALGRLWLESWHNLSPIAGVVAIPALVMGASFPLANANVQSLEDSVGGRAGVLYLFNTLGNVFGALLAGFVLLPLLGTQTGAGVLGGIAALGLVPLVLLHRAETRTPRHRMLDRVPAGCVLLLVLVIGAWSLLPENYLLRSAIPRSNGEDHRVLALSEGINETVAVVDEASQLRRLWTNGYPMSSSHPSAQRYMRLFSHIPLLQSADPKRVLVICMGVGNTLHAASLHSSVDELEVVDLSRNVLEHAHYFSGSNRNIIDDPRVTVFINDGRQHLRMQDDGRYDLITLEPPPIAAAGVSALYSREFYALARTKLRDGGAMTQWLPAYQVSGDTTLSVIRAFLDVFPNAVLLSGHLREFILLGVASEANRFDLARVRDKLAASPTLQRELTQIWAGSLTELVGSFVAGPEALAAATSEVPAVTDDLPLMEYSGRAHLFESRLPESIFAMSGVARWCPTCFENGHAVPEVASLGPYLAALETCYLSDDFLGFSQLMIPRPSTAGGPSSIDALSEPAVRNVISESAYLRYIFLGPIHDDEAMARRNTPCAIPADERWRFQR